MDDCITARVIDFFSAMTFSALTVFQPETNVTKTLVKRKMERKQEHGC